MDAAATPTQDGDDVVSTPPGYGADPRRAALTNAIRNLTIETDRYTETKGSARGMHRTHLHALVHIMDAERRGEVMTPGGLSAALSLSAAATSALLERLETAGHATRAPSAHDRRSVSIRVTPDARSVGRELFAPLGTAMLEAMHGYTDAELDLVTRFVGDAVQAIVHARER